MNSFRIIALGSTIRSTSKSRSFSTNTSYLKNKTVLITGSTSGIGLGIAQSFAAQGCSVLFNGFGSSDEIAKIEKQFQTDYKVKTSYHGADLAKPDQIRSLFEHANKTFGGVDILVNNAGIQHVSPVQDFSQERWDAVIAINLSSVFHTIKEALPHMQKQKWGRIINISSVHGLVGSVNKSAYVAAKHGVVGLTKVVALENAGTGITCNSINPGWVRTPLVERQIEAKASANKTSIEEASVRLLEEKQPSKQFVSVDQLGQTAVFLAGEGASQITGISVPVDGGWTAQ